MKKPVRITNMYTRTRAHTYMLHRSRKLLCVCMCVVVVVVVAVLSIINKIWNKTEFVVVFVSSK